MTLARSTISGADQGGRLLLSETAEPILTTAFSKTGGAIGLVVGGVGIMVLVGWLTGVTVFTSGIPGAIPMLPWTATAFTLAAICLWIDSRGWPQSRRAKPLRVARAVCATAAFAIGLAMLVQRLGSLDWALNGLLFGTALATLPYRPIGLMASNSAACFSLIGIGLILRGTEKGARLRTFGFAVALLISFFSVLGHIYGISSLYSLDRYAGMAPITTISFALLTFGLLMTESTSRYYAVLSGEGSTSLFTRRLLVASVIIPVIFGRLWLAARRHELISRELGVSFFVIMMVVLFVVIILWAAGAMLAVERAREKLRSDAERANGAKSEFLAVISHELRTPLNAIRGYTDLMQLEIAGALNSTQREYVQRIQRSETHLLSLIDDILDYTQTETGRLRYEITDVNLVSVISDVLLLTQPRAERRGVRLINDVSDGKRSVRGDSDRIHQILVNLVTNAIKYSGSGDSVTLSSALVVLDGRSLIEVSVRDVGPGISPENLNSIFQPFVQLESGLTRQAEGLGLGLAISRTMARAMDGDIHAASVPGTGSVFTLRLPAAAINS